MTLGWTEMGFHDCTLNVICTASINWHAMIQSSGVVAFNEPFLPNNYKAQTTWPGLVILGSNAWHQWENIQYLRCNTMQALDTIGLVGRHHFRCGSQQSIGEYPSVAMLFRFNEYKNPCLEEILRVSWARKHRTVLLDGSFRNSWKLISVRKLLSILYVNIG